MICKECKKQLEEKLISFVGHAPIKFYICKNEKCNLFEMMRYGKIKLGDII